MNLFKKKQPINAKEVIEEIHNSFNSAGEILLAEALQIIEEKASNINKVERLIKCGFSQAAEVQQFSMVKVTKEIADLIQHYQVRYPFNKFITEDQVIKICKKYNLVSAPVDRYKGFVPDEKLKQIESFRLNSSDLPPRLFKVLSAWNTGVSDFLFRKSGAKHIHKILGLDLIPTNHPDVIMHGNNIFGIRRNNGEIGYIEKVRLYNHNQDLQICAPASDMNLVGLQKFGSFFKSFTDVTVPDPVVLQPVNGGYLIVAAWGDEASDPVVVNTLNN